MNKILTTDLAVELGTALAQEKKHIVLAGGCFDILHIGHLAFIEKAKAYGDVLCVLLEADETITAAKGPKRPINSQEDRAKLLSALSAVDYVFMLPPGMTNDAYDALVFAIKPAIIATTKGDVHRNHKERQANAISAQVVDVVQLVDNRSTTKIIEILNEL
jgi:rfaE bifunctional protein nucleotidyltransferase chain/domain